MHEFLADLHIHSRFSRATSKKLDIPLLAAWAGVKGIAVLGTGDFTHPQWREELRQHLRHDEASGLYLLKEGTDLESILPELPVRLQPQRGHKGGTGPARNGVSKQALPPVHFMLQGEISSIYKRGGKVRKVHNLVYMPSLEAAERFSLRLAQTGNLHSDGRPILGLDSRDLLEMVLEADPLAFLIPAHIWTPWFSIFGSKSGFDRLEDCFADLSANIFALETGLSSDPDMNRMWSALDGYRLVSNSDAHSGENLGREANLFSGDISYAGMLKALRDPGADNATRFLGTLEFFPEEGKYHMDGHRKCGMQLTPAQTRELGGVCPVCGGPLTVGVLSRVMELADRDEPCYEPCYEPGQPRQGKPEQADAGRTLPQEPAPEQPALTAGSGTFASLVPLPEILGEILGVGAKSRRVFDLYSRVLERFGPELQVLRLTPEADLARFFPPLGEAIGRMRRGEVLLNGGYDGEYGKVRMFTEAEQAEIRRGAGLFSRKSGRAVAGLSLLGEEPPPGDAARRKKKNAPAKARQQESGQGAELERQERETLQRQTAGAPGGQSREAELAPGPEGDPAFEEGEDFVFSTLDLVCPPGTEAAGPADGPLAAAAGAEPCAAGTLPRQTAGPEQGTEEDRPKEDGADLLAGLNREQEQAVLAGPSPVLVLAGPGTGKTRTLIARIQHILEDGISARRIVALTFTRRAASEIDSRLAAALGAETPLPRTDTLHALALELWHKTHSDVPVLLSEESARRVFAEANPEENPQSIREAWQAVNLARERLEQPPPDYSAFASNYQAQKSAWNLADYTDLLEFWLEQIHSGLYSAPWGHVLVDEVQDLSPLQLNLITALLPSPGEGFFGIGDPDQSIYGFRGAHGKSLAFFRSTWPGLEVIRLLRNYRSLPPILNAAYSVITHPSGADMEAQRRPLEPKRAGGGLISL
ncbi:UvrD-helicase domain-containing protein, partial [Desulfovibrio sp. OttesenSCG-928-A18]|nr:UvrD-helicase domain-containing protein [Desulfovibrio sp. OttesenSCG-928-A18]